MPSEVSRIRVGEWLASPALNLLERDGQSIKIEPRAMDVLIVLASSDGAVVSVEELIAAVWKGVVVGDGSVYLAISQLRQVLDQDVGTQHIETIPKRGYRLTVSVEHIGRETPGPQADTRKSPDHRTKSPVHKWVFAAVCVAAISAAVALNFRNGVRPTASASVAVLPFDNLSSDPEQAYFAEGVTAEVLNTLSRIRNLRVAGQISSFHFKGRKEDLRTIGEALGVDHILEGSVRKAGDQVRITAHLRNAKTGEHLWSETYERTLDDIFRIQDEIASSVADALQVRLGVGDVARMPGMTRNVAAFDEYLRGMALNLEWRRESMPSAIAHLQRAVALDPSFSLAWSGLNTLLTNGALLVPEQAATWRAEGADALAHARALTPDAPHVLLETGIGEARSGQWLKAAETYAALERSYSKYGMADLAAGPRGIFLLGVGRAREAVPALENARATEPLAPAFAAFLSSAYLADRNLDAARAEVDRGQALEGLDANLRATALVIALTARDQMEIEKRLKVLSSSSDSNIQRELTRFIDAPSGSAAAIRRLAATNPTEKAWLARWAAYFHEPQLALELLAQAAPTLFHPAQLWEPLMQESRKLPEFKTLVRRLGYVDYWRAYGWSDFCRPQGAEDFACE